jgi:hypothetical protein
MDIATGSVKVTNPKVGGHGPPSCNTPFFHAALVLLLCLLAALRACAFRRAFLLLMQCGLTW